MPHSFGASSAGERLELLRRQHAKFKLDPLDEALANDLCVIAWSLCDWIFKEHGSRLNFVELGLLQCRVKIECPTLALVQDIANGSKHKIIEKYSPKLKDAGLHKGDFSREFSRDFDVSHLVVTTNSGDQVWFEDVIESAVAYWTTFFQINQIP